MQQEVVFGLIGYPLGHSFSKILFTERFSKEGLDNCRFELYPLENIRLFPKLLSDNPAIRGLAVTIPYKEQVIPYLTGCSAEAAAIGAVNCILINGAERTGYNTDVIGFEASLKPLLKPWHNRALVLGTGGASKGVQYVLKKHGIPFTVVSRFEHNDTGYTTYGSLGREDMDQHKLIINCTPVGMSPNEDGLPAIPYEFVGNEHLLYDLIYKPMKTRFLMEGESRGAAISNGYRMFEVQAEANWEIWASGAGLFQ